MLDRNTNPNPSLLLRRLNPNPSLRRTETPTLSIHRDVLSSVVVASSVAVSNNEFHSFQRSLYRPTKS